LIASINELQEFWRSLGRALINLRRCPVRPDTDRLCATAANVAKGHEETHALQQTAALFDHVVGNGEQPERSMPSVRAVFMLMTNSKFCRPQRWRVGGLALPSLR
jgi:hypothetical protein